MKPPGPPSASANRIAGGVLAGLLVTALAYFVALHARFVFLPGPQESRETAIPLMTRLLLSPARPYTLETLPEYTDVYGIVYNYAVLPAAMVWGPTFAVHRAASLLFLAMGAALVYAALRRENVDRGLAFAGGAFFYLVNGATYAIVARPDTLGELLMLAVFLLTLPGGGKASIRGKLFLSAALGVLAFYTKPYFVVSLALATVSLFATLGWRWALGYAVGAGALLLASMPLVTYFWPYYLYSLLNVNAYAIGHVDGFLWKQIKDFLILHGGIIAAAALACGLWVKSSPTRGQKWRRPDPWGVALAVAVAFLIVVLGPNAGAFRTYWTQLASPFLIVVAVRAVSRLPQWWRAAGLGLLAVNALGMVSWSRIAWPEDSAPAWDEWHALTAGRPWQLRPIHILEDESPPGVPVLNNGQTIYFANAALEHLPANDPAHRRVAGYTQLMHDLILQRRFDVIVMPNEYKFYITPEFLAEHYDPYLVEFPIYFLYYGNPEYYGRGRKELTAWLRKPGPEHAPLAASPSVP